MTQNGIDSIDYLKVDIEGSNFISLIHRVDLCNVSNRFRLIELRFGTLI